jgi:hypothetical protein
METDTVYNLRLRWAIRRALREMQPTAGIIVLTGIAYTIVMRKKPVGQRADSMG